MSIFVIGINHKTATLALREKVYFASDKLPLYLQDLLARGIATSAVLLSTCNRSELYCETVDSLGIYEWFCEQAEGVSNAIYLHRDEQAVAHIMKVACGLDSMILGESQILGQLKTAYSESCSAGTVSSVFHRLFQQVFTVAKEIRTATYIGACPVSVASASINFVREQLPAATVAVIGAGETAELLLRYLRRETKSPIRIINRNLDHAQGLSDQYNCQAFKLEYLSEALAPCDIVFSATGSVAPIVTLPCIARVMESRDKPMTLIDIAVPRDIDPDVSTLKGINLFCIDDLKIIIEKNLQGREHAALKAYEMIEERSKSFIREFEANDKVTHTITAYRSQIEEICQEQLHKARQHLSQGLDPHSVLESFAKAFINKLMHSPSVQLRQAGLEGRFELLNYAKQLFAIPDVEAEQV